MEENVDKKLEKLFKHASVVGYKKGEFIIRAEDEPKGIYYLKKGYVKFYNLSIEGKEQVLNIFKPKSYFPIAWFLSGTSNNAYYEALTPVKLSKLPPEKVLNFLEENPDSLMKLTRRLSSGLGGLSKLLNILFLASATQKVAFVLVRLASRFGQKDGKKIIVNLPVTHQLISSYAGLVRETVSLEMQKLRKQKIIDYTRSSLTILNLKKLEQLSQYDNEKDGEVV